MAEVVACPNCRRQLQVPEQYFGQQVQCPECRHLFTAAAMPAPTPPSPPIPRSEDRRPRDDYDQPARRGRYDDDDNDDGPEYDVRNRRGRRDLAPHRGTLLLVLGLLSLFLCSLLGPVAWIMGNTDLREIHAGRMDPTGESLTRAGQVCGMIATLLLILGTLFVCFRSAAFNRF